MPSPTSHEDQVKRVLGTLNLEISAEEATKKLSRMAELCAKYNVQAQPATKDDGQPHKLSDIATKFSIPQPWPLSGDLPEILYQLHSPGILDPLGSNGNLQDHYPPISTSWVMPFWYPQGYDSSFPSGASNYKQSKIDKIVRFDQSLFSLEAIEAWTNNQKEVFSSFCNKLDIHGMPVLMFLASSDLEKYKPMMKSAALAFVTNIKPVADEYYANDYSHQPGREKNITKGQVFAQEVQNPLKEIFGINVSLTHNDTPASLSGKDSDIDADSDFGAASAAGGGNG